MKYRINGFQQIERFYSIVFSGEFEFKTHHISLYMFLLNQNNRNGWAEWFKCPLDIGLQGSQIGSKKTYYAVLEELKKFGLIDYQKGVNEWKAPKVKLIELSSRIEPQLIPQCEPQVEPQTTSLPIPQPIPLPTSLLHPDNKYITDNLQLLIISNKEKLLKEKCILKMEFEIKEKVNIPINPFSPETVKNGITFENWNLLSDEEQKKYISEIKNMFINQFSYQEKVARNFKLSVPQVQTRIQEFWQLQILDESYKWYEGWNTVTGHFSKWLNVQLKKTA